MENLKKLLEFLAPFPKWLRVLIACIVTAVISICIISCGVTQTFVNNTDSDNASFNMTVNPSQSTSSTVSPEVQVIPEL